MSQTNSETPQQTRPQALQNIVVVGGGSAGWLSAAVLAAKHCHQAADQGVTVTLIESSDIASVGVGEGTWPTMRNTLRQIGIQESQLFRHCHAAFKQGGKFVNWVHQENDFYYHPFTVPLGYGRLDLAPYVSNIADFAQESNFQHHVCEAGLAPRHLGDDEFQGPCNYAYHLDAGAFAELLKQHCVDTLGVRHIIGTVSDVILDGADNIEHLRLNDGQQIAGDLFIDCTGFPSRLLGQALQVPFVSCRDILFNDRALAVHVPDAQESPPLASHTIATGHRAGWTWDIGLTNRRGVGLVYSSHFSSEDEAEHTLRHYLASTQPADSIQRAISSDALDLKAIRFDSGHRQTFWKNNCIAVGLSAGFVEPLEATALMLIEISARYLADNLPADRSLMALTARRFNQQMHYRWRRIIDFLKLHYLLTQRTEPYWQAHTDPATIPASLKDDLALWRYRGPLHSDFDSAIELFPAASYQYVMYGMGFKPDFSRQAYLHTAQQQAQQLMQRNQTLTRQMLASLPRHRDYIQHWLAKVS